MATVPNSANKLFNNEFVFDEGNTNPVSTRPSFSIQNQPAFINQQKLQQQQAQKQQEEDPVVDNELEADDFETIDAGEETFKQISKKKDHVRVKSASAKKLAAEENNFFEIPTTAEMAKKAEATSFQDMHISKPLTKALSLLNLTTPTIIQSAAIPTALSGKDICACAVTGSGKTLAFMLPTLERLLFKPKFPQVTRVLVLTPTRELAAQICKVTRDLCQFTNINSVLCAGGFDIKTQEAALRLGPDVVIATPGRLIDHLHNTPSFNLETVEILILDEADRMLDEVFAEQLKEVIRLCSKTRQTLLFSATMTDKVEDLVRMSLKRPVKIFISDNMDVTPLLKQEFVRLRDASERNREAILAALIQRKFNDRVIVFVKTKNDCHRLSLLLNLLQIKTAELHGGLSQTGRLEKLNAFKDGTYHVMVATDLASRGLDIANVKTVINFAMPLSFKHYIHRVGRTARAENTGRAISLVGENDRWLVKEIVKSSKTPVKCRVIPADVLQIYRDKVYGIRDELMSTLNEEKSEKVMEKMENDINRAEKNMNKSPEAYSKGSFKNRNKSNSVDPLRRTWLSNVDYKNGGLLSDKKNLEKNAKKPNNKKRGAPKDDNEENTNNDDDGKRPHKKAKFLTKSHKAQHDNIFSKKFKQNKIATRDDKHKRQKRTIK